MLNQANQLGIIYICVTVKKDGKDVPVMAEEEKMSDQQLDMLSGFLFGWGFGLIMGYYFI